MNAKPQTAPPVLLFDDPVAHIDDFNSLSFLEHLRDLALAETRQIFTPPQTPVSQVCLNTSLPFSETNSAVSIFHVRATMVVGFASLHFP
jgi:hypothetical protein